MCSVFQWCGLNLQNGANFLTQALDSFHDLILTFLILILVLVGGLMLVTFSNKSLVKVWSESPALELGWTIAPGIILILIGSPSLHLLYLSEEDAHADLSLKVVGHQWFWSYDYIGLGVQFDAYMTPLSELPMGGFRLLETDNTVVLPVNTSIRAIISSSDVLHAWALPSLSVKADAAPGRLNLSWVSSLMMGHFAGQCSEICGANHSFMPIKVEMTSLSGFKHWLKAITLA